MYCPNCRSEYRLGFAHCPDCDVDLVDELPPELEPVPPPNDGYDDLVTVYISNRFDAEMMRAVLEGSGIPAVNTAGTAGAYPVNVGAMGEGRVLVKRADEVVAREVLAAALQGDLENGCEPKHP